MDVNDILDGNINRHWHHNRWAKDAVSSQRGNSIRIREPARYRVSVEQGKVSAACNRLGYRTPGVDKYKNKSIANDVLISLKPDGFDFQSNNEGTLYLDEGTFRKISTLGCRNSAFFRSRNRTEHIGTLLICNANHAPSDPPESSCEDRHHNAGQTSDGSGIGVRRDKSTDHVQLYPKDKLDQNAVSFMKGLEGLGVLALAYTLMKKL